MRIYKIFVLFAVFLFHYSAFSGTYFGIGGTYLIPQGAFSDYNQESVGLKLEFMNKNYCKLWYGIRLDYIPLSKKDAVVNYYDRTVAFSGVIKFAPFAEDCYDYKLVPYLEGVIGFSSIAAPDHFQSSGSNLGFGGGLGVGLAFNFKLFKKCWMFEIDGMFYAPNSIYRDEKRDNLQSINVGLTLSMGL